MKISSYVSKKITTVFLLLSVYSSFVTAKIIYRVILPAAYYSYKPGAWNNAISVWSKTGPTGTACSCAPGSNLVSNNTVYIYNNITSNNMLSSMAGSSIINIEAGDSLIITIPTFSVTVSANINVNLGGTLIINGVLAMSGKSTINNNGNVIINGSVNNSGNAIVTNNGTLIVNGTVTTTNTASFAGTGVAYATGQISGSGTDMFSDFSTVFCKLITQTGSGLVSYYPTPVLSFQPINFNNNTSAVLTGDGKFIDINSIPGILNSKGILPNQLLFITGKNTLASMPFIWSAPNLIVPNGNYITGPSGTALQMQFSETTNYSRWLLTTDGGSSDNEGIDVSSNSKGNGQVGLFTPNSYLAVNSDKGSIFQDNTSIILNAPLTEISGASFQDFNDPTKSARIVTSLLVSGDSLKDTLPDKSGIFAMTSDIQPTYWAESDNGQFKYKTPARKNIYYNSGNVGIGTTNPAVALDVAGDINVSGSLTMPTIASASGTQLLSIDTTGKITTLRGPSLSRLVYPQIPSSPPTNCGTVTTPGWYLGAPVSSLNFPQSQIATDLCTWVGIGTAGQSMPDAALTIASNVGPLAFSVSNPISNASSTDPYASPTDYFTIDNIGNTIIAGTLNVDNTVHLYAVNSSPFVISNYTGLANVFTIDNAGVTNAGFGINSVSFGGANTGAPYFVQNYFGFNVARDQANLQWKAGTDGSGNGGAVMMTDGIGNIRFAGIPSTSGTSKTISDAALFANTSIIVGSSGGMLLRNPLNPNCTQNAYTALNLGGNASPGQYLLAVDGGIIAHEILIQPCDGSWCDYVFDKNYKLPSLKETEQYIAENHHLPDVPSAQEVKDNGIKVGEMDAALLKKIEELTLYTIELQKQMEIMKDEIVKLKQTK